MNDGDRIAGEEKERNTEAKVNGQHQARLKLTEKGLSGKDPWDRGARRRVIRNIDST